MSDSKKCRTCGKTLPIDKFYSYLDNRTRKTYTFLDCRRCHYLKTDQRRKTKYNNNKDAAFKQVWKKLGIDLTKEKALKLIEAQEWKCALCRDDLTETGSHVDHDHSTGELRGILCPACNKGIGHFQDDPHLLRLAIAYLERYSK
jgi:hypothetical protein